MSFIERRSLDRPTAGAAPFELGETFFSRTDERGVILAANDIFRRVSGYSWEEIVGVPHKTIRHPDMPRGFFQYFWDTIQSGKPIVGYTKNLSKDGLYYWVLAVIVPTEGGFLSVRVKPCSGLLARVEELYNELSRCEREEGLSPEASAALMQEKFVAMGYTDYSDFESQALGEELTEVDRHLNNQVDRSIEGFKQIIPEVAILKANTEKLTTLFETVGTIPTNLRILASRLEPSGGPLSSLSENYWKMSDEMTTWFTHFVSSSGNAFSSIRSAINQAMLLRCAARLLNESAVQFASERRQLGGLDAEKERKNITELALVYERKACVSLSKTAQEAKEISTAISILRRHILGLSTTRIMCKIESAALHNGGESLNDIIGHFEVFQKDVDVILENLDNASVAILSNSSGIKGYS